MFAGSSLVVGGLLALTLPIRERLLGCIMAFGAGVLISAVAYELVAEAYETAAGPRSLALGLAAGALTFFVGDARRSSTAASWSACWPRSGSASRSH